MTIGIICAIPQELAHLESLLTNPQSQKFGAVTYLQGMLDDHDVVLAGAGIGKVNTAMTATIMADRYACRLIIFSGVAGGLDPALQIGDVVIADRTIQHDAGVIQDEKIMTYQAGHVPFFNPTDKLGYDVPAALIDKIKPLVAKLDLPPLSKEAGGSGKKPNIVYGTILAGDQFMNCEKTRERLFMELGGRAIEMEGGALGQTCEAFNIPHLDIRALSDLAGQEAHFDFASFVDEVAASSATILRAILRAV